MKKVMIAVAAAAVALGGCTQASRGLGQLTANKYAEARSGTNWLVAPPQLEPPVDRTVYISFRNLSDADLDLRALMIEGAQDQGWTVVNDPNAATYRLRGDLRFFGEVEPESGGAGAAAGLGAIAGAAATGIAVGAATRSLTDNNTAGYVAGGVTGALVAQGLSNASRPREWAAIVDVVLEEKTAQPVTFEMVTDSSSNRATVGGTGNSRQVLAGGETSGNSSVATSSRTSNYYPHGIRLSAWANQMNMSEEEAFPEIEMRVKRVIGQMLPV
ncbi:MAG: complement resistance protein TraT [Pseudomonadota bacterium]